MFNTLAAEEDRQKRLNAEWQAAPKAEPAPGQAIYLEHHGEFAFELDEYLDGLVDQNRDPASDRPYLCERRRPAAPDLAELIRNDVEQEWCNMDGDFTLDLPDVSDLQAELDRRFAAAPENYMTLWFASKTALDVTAPAFLEQLAAHREKRAKQTSSQVLHCVTCRRSTWHKREVCTEHLPDSPQAQRKEPTP